MLITRGNVHFAEGVGVLRKTTWLLSNEDDGQAYTLPPEIREYSKYGAIIPFPISLSTV